MKMNCEQCRPLVPGYLDGELGEALASPLRAHLLACPVCREVAQGQRAQATWFQASEAPAIPHGFAARVARLAFEGVGPREALTLIPRPERSLELAGAAGSAPPQILVWATAAAAAVLFTLSIALGGRDLPTSDALYADSQLADVLEDLDRLHAQDARDSKAPAAAPEAAPGSKAQDAQPAAGR